MRQNRSRHALRCLEGQAGRSLETCGLERDPEEDHEVSCLAEERGGGERSRARSLGLKCGKHLGEEELLEKEAGRGGAGRGEATRGAERGLQGWSCGPGEHTEAGLSSCMAKPRVCPFESVP